MTADERYAAGELQVVSIYGDGLRLVLAPDAVDGSYCAGANVRWNGSNVEFTLVKAASGSSVPVSHPSYVHPNGRRYIFIPLEHVPRGTQIFYDVVVGDPAGGSITERHGLMIDQPPVACDWPASSPPR
jgi:hypothetical protein